MQAAGDDHRAAGQKYRPIPRAAPQHQPVPARRPLIRKQGFADAGMDAVGTDQDIPAHGAGVGAGPIEEIRRDAALVLGEGAEPAAGVNRLRSEPLLDSAVDHALQPAAVNRELRHVMTGIDAAGLAPDLLAVTIEIIEDVGADRGIVELLQQPEAGELADRMRKRIDSVAEFADGVRLLEQLAADAARPQHQRSGKAANSTPDDNRFHRLLHATRHANRWRILRDAAKWPLLRMR